MSCEQEMCPFWDGHGCPCKVLDISEDEREKQKRFLGIGAYETWLEER